MTDTISLYVKLHHIYFCSCRYFQICFSLLGNNVQAFFLPSLLLQNPLTCSKHEDYLSKLWSACIIGEGNGTQEEGRLPKWSIFFISSLVRKWSRKQDISPNANVNTHCKKHHRQGPVLKKKNKGFSKGTSPPPPPPSCSCLFVSLWSETPI